MFIVVRLLYIIHMTPFPKKGLLCKKKDQKRTISAVESCFKDLRSKKGPKKDHFSSLVLKRTKSLIKDLYGSTVSRSEVWELRFSKFTLPETSKRIANAGTQNCEYWPLWLFIEGSAGYRINGQLSKETIRYLGNYKIWPVVLEQTSQELQMLSSVTLNS